MYDRYVFERDDTYYYVREFETGKEHRYKLKYKNPYHYTLGIDTHRGIAFSEHALLKAMTGLSFIYCETKIKGLSSIYSENNLCYIYGKGNTNVSISIYDYFERMNAYILLGSDYNITFVLKEKLHYDTEEKLLIRNCSLKNKVDVRDLNAKLINFYKFIFGRSEVPVDSSLIIDYPERFQDMRKILNLDRNLKV